MSGFPGLRSGPALLALVLALIGTAGLGPRLAAGDAEVIEIYDLSASCEPPPFTRSIYHEHTCARPSPLQPVPSAYGPSGWPKENSTTFPAGSVTPQNVPTGGP